MNIHKGIVKRHFDRHAHEYDDYAHIQVHMGDQLIKQLNARIKKRKSIRSILEIGCGTGTLTAKLLRLFPDARYTVIDLSEQMIEQTRRKLGALSEKVDFVAGDAEDDRLLASTVKKPIDLIISNATFQWFNEPQATIPLYAGMLSREGLLAFSSFGPDTFHELRASFREAEQTLQLPHQPRSQAFYSKEHWFAYFALMLGNSGEKPSPVYAGDVYLDWREETVRMEYPAVHDFLLSIKRVGAGNAAGEGGGPSGGRKLFSLMEDSYKHNYASENGGIFATYHIQFGFLQKKE